MPALPPSPIRRLASLLPADPKLVDAVAARLRLSNAQRKRLGTAAARDGDPGDPRALAYTLGREEAFDRLLLAGRDTASIEGWDMPVFPLKGGAIVERGVEAGPEVARILQTVKAQWIEEGFPDEARVAELLDAAIAT